MAIKSKEVSSTNTESKSSRFLGITALGGDGGAVGPHRCSHNKVIMMMMLMLIFIISFFSSSTFLQGLFRRTSTRSSSSSSKNTSILDSSTSYPEEDLLLNNALLYHRDVPLLLPPFSSFSSGRPRSRITGSKRKTAFFFFVSGAEEEENTEAKKSENFSRPSPAPSPSSRHQSSVFPTPPRLPSSSSSFLKKEAASRFIRRVSTTSFLSFTSLWNFFWKIKNFHIFLFFFEDNPGSAVPTLFMVLGILLIIIHAKTWQWSLWHVFYQQVPPPLENYYPSSHSSSFPPLFLTAHDDHEEENERERENKEKEEEKNKKNGVTTATSTTDSNHHRIFRNIAYIPVVLKVKKEPKRKTERQTTTTTKRRSSGSGREKATLPPPPQQHHLEPKNNRKNWPWNSIFSFSSSSSESFLTPPSPSPLPPPPGRRRVGVVLGSGGHTSEMLRTIRFLSIKTTSSSSSFSYPLSRESGENAEGKRGGGSNHCHRHEKEREKNENLFFSNSLWKEVRPLYFYSRSDLHSRKLAEEMEETLFHRRGPRSVRFIPIPRARSVGQSYWTSIFTTIHANFMCFLCVLGVWRYSSTDDDDDDDDDDEKEKTEKEEKAMTATSAHGLHQTPLPSSFFSSSGGGCKHSDVHPSHKGTLAPSSSPLPSTDASTTRKRKSKSTRASTTSSTSRRRWSSPTIRRARTRTKTPQKKHEKKRGRCSPFDLPDVLLLNGPGVCVPVVFTCVTWAVICAWVRLWCLIPRWIMEKWSLPPPLSSSLSQTQNKNISLHHHPPPPPREHEGVETPHEEEEKGREEKEESPTRKTPSFSFPSFFTFRSFSFVNLFRGVVRFLFGPSSGIFFFLLLVHLRGGRCFFISSPLTPSLSFSFLFPVLLPTFLGFFFLVQRPSSPSCASSFTTTTTLHRCFFRLHHLFGFFSPFLVLRMLLEPGISTLLFHPLFQYRRPAIIFMESFTCISSPSLTLKLLLLTRCVDVITVHWKPIEEKIASTTSPSSSSFPFSSFSLPNHRDNGKTEGGEAMKMERGGVKKMIVSCLSHHLPWKRRWHTLPTWEDVCSEDDDDDDDDENDDPFQHHHDYYGPHDSFSSLRTSSRVVVGECKKSSSSRCRLFPFSATSSSSSSSSFVSRSISASSLRPGFIFSADLFPLLVNISSIPSSPPPLVSLPSQKQEEHQREGGRGEENDNHNHHNKVALRHHPFPLLLLSSSMRFLAAMERRRELHEANVTSSVFSIYSSEAEGEENNLKKTQKTEHDKENTLPPLSTPPLSLSYSFSSLRSALVTVGSTSFKDLISHVLTKELCSFLYFDAHIDVLLLQYGSLSPSFVREKLEGGLLFNPRQKNSDEEEEGKEGKTKKRSEEEEEGGGGGGARGVEGNLRELVWRSARCCCDVDNNVRNGHYRHHREGPYWHSSFFSHRASLHTPLFASSQQQRQLAPSSSKEEEEENKRRQGGSITISTEEEKHEVNATRKGEGKDYDDPQKRRRIPMTMRNSVTELLRAFGVEEEKEEIEEEDGVHVIAEKKSEEEKEKSSTPSFTSSTTTTATSSSSLLVFWEPVERCTSLPTTATTTGSTTGNRKKKEEKHDGKALPSSVNVHPSASPGLLIMAFPYHPQLRRLITAASLVISHAGAGTILEGLEAYADSCTMTVSHEKPKTKKSEEKWKRKKGEENLFTTTTTTTRVSSFSPPPPPRPHPLLFVVPNRSLMNNHQLELAERLAAHRYLIYSEVLELQNALRTTLQQEEEREEKRGWERCIQLVQKEIQKVLNFLEEEREKEKEYVHDTSSYSSSERNKRKRWEAGACVLPLLDDLYDLGQVEKNAVHQYQARVLHWDKNVLRTAAAAATTAAATTAAATTTTAAATTREKEKQEEGKTEENGLAVHMPAGWEVHDGDDDDDDGDDEGSNGSLRNIFHGPDWVQTRSALSVPLSGTLWLGI